ncbi:MAG: PadR family transcriptional regulator, partial [Gemmatimonadales bacterium]
MPAPRPLLDFALLGLLARAPASGYDLRKVFQETLLGRYSDSPGSIYPALRRLQAGRLIRGQRAPGGRHRCELEITDAGRTTLHRWLEAPIDGFLAASDRGAFELKLAFFSDHRPLRQLRTFLLQYSGALDDLRAETVAARAAARDHLT